MDQKIYKFSELIHVAKASHCATCETYVYTLPCPLDLKIEPHLAQLGKPRYSLQHTQILRIENENVVLNGRLGRPWFEVRFNKEPAIYKRLFDIVIAGYVAEVQAVEVTLD